MDFNKLAHDWWGVLIPIIGMLAAGRTLKRLVLLPFELWARKSDNVVVDAVVADAERDLGLDPLPEEKKPDGPNK